MNMDIGDKVIFLSIGIVLVSLGVLIFQYNDYDNLEKYEGFCESYNMTNKGNSDFSIPICYRIVDEIIYEEFFIRERNGEHYLEEVRR